MCNEIKCAVHENVQIGCTEIKEQKQKAKIQKGTGTAKTRVKENLNKKRKQN